MCDCSKVHLFEVEFKLDGMTVVPTHKNCGFQQELVKSWGLDDEESD